MPEPKCLTDAEVEQLLKATRQHHDPRDHMALLVALSTALRLHELCALNVGDVLGARGIHEAVHLTTEKGKPTGSKPGRVLLREGLRRKLARYLAHKARTGQPLEASSPLWARAHGPPPGGHTGLELDVATRWRRLGKRGMQDVFYGWQHRLGWRTSTGRLPYTFHCLRHTAVTAVLARSNNLELARIFARHASADSTKRYLHLSPEKLLEALPTWER